jgi:hypothetical protein
MNSALAWQCISNMSLYNCLESANVIHSSQLGLIAVPGAQSNLPDARELSPGERLQQTVCDQPSLNAMNALVLHA